MMQVQNITDHEQILSLLYKFDCVFCHMHEKVQNYGIYAQKLADKAQVYLMQEKEETCGLVVMYDNDTVESVAFVALFGLLPGWQGKMLGKEMMDLCCTKAKASGMKKMRLEVDLDNHRAIAFYLRNGFIPAGECSSISMYMEKTLV